MVIWPDFYGFFLWESTKATNRGQYTFTRCREGNVSRCREGKAMGVSLNGVP